MSSLINAATGAIESLFGGALKYNAPLKKCRVLSVKIN
jgi:hypothetical protein